MRSSRILFLAFMVACADAALAQKIGRYVYPDGRVVYSDQPVPGARLANEVAPPPPPSAPAPSGAGETRGGRPAKAGESPGSARSRAAADAEAEVRAAADAVRDARNRLQAGIEPLAGERTGLAGGGSRLNEAYQARQAANQQAVADAEARLQRAIAARDAAR